jgi:hypothetical protein
MYSEKEKLWQPQDVTPSQAVPINKEKKLEEWPSANNKLSASSNKKNVI